MASVHSSSPFYQMTEYPAIISLLRHHSTSTTAAADATNPSATTATNTTDKTKRKPSSSGGGGGGGLLKMFKLFPMLTSGCKMVALLGRPRRRPPLLKDKATTGTIFGYRRGRVSLAVQDDPHCMPAFVIELPLQTAALNKEMHDSGDGAVRIALESEAKTHRKKLLEEFVWAVFCNGRKVGYSIRRMHMTEDELHVMHSLRGVSMGAGILPPSSSSSASAAAENSADGELTYVRARFERVVGSKDSEALYMINPDGNVGPELSIFFVRSH